MKGTVAKYQTPKGDRWRIAADVGQHACQRCADCNWRVWLDGRRLQRCAKCDGEVVDGFERRQFFRKGFTRERDAQRALRDVLGDQDRGDQFVAPSRQTVADYLRGWLEGRRLRATSAANYRGSIDTYVIPRLGGKQLQALTAEDLDQLYRWMEREGGRNGQGLAPKTVRHAHTAVRKALQDALDRGYVTRNVADLANPPTQRDAKSRKAEKVWSAEQLRAFLAHVVGDRLYALWLLACTTGLRRAELCALRWEDVDLDAGRLRVAQTVTIAGGALVWADNAKTDAGVRTLALDPATVAALRAHRRRQSEERLAAGPGWIDDDHGPLVFTTTVGAVVKPDRLLRTLIRHAKACGLPRTDVHGLRHAYATAALKSGGRVDVLSARLGHSSPSITLDVYAHVQEGDDEQLAVHTTAAILGE